MPFMYAPRPKALPVNVHPSRVEGMLACGWALEPFHEEQRVEPAPKLSGHQRAAIRAGASYEPPASRSLGEGRKPKTRRSREGKDAET